MPHGSDTQLKKGFTTGTAAAAAAKAALIRLLTGVVSDTVTVRALTGESLEIPVHSCAKIDGITVQCSVIKNGGDDPDITHGAEIGVVVTHNPQGIDGRIDISGGKGVGKVTKPGLEISPGEPAINTGPRRMIRESLLEVLGRTQCKGSVAVEVFAPEGETLAKKTLNARLGILGGISILGTTGIVNPLSHEAYTATIRSALSVAKEEGLTSVVMTTGRRSERYAQALWPLLSETAFIQMGDYFQFGLQSARDAGFSAVRLVVFFGKALKMAQGIAHTHAARAPLTLDILASWARKITGDDGLAPKILASNTARHAFDHIHPHHPEVIRDVGIRMLREANRFSGPGLSVRCVMLGYDGSPIFDLATE